MTDNVIYPFKQREDFLKDVVKEPVQLRKKRNYTQEELNYRLGVADRLISKWECGTRTPTSFNLYCWADALNTKLKIVANANDKPHNRIAEKMELPANDNQERDRLRKVA